MNRPRYGTAEKDLRLLVVFFRAMQSVQRKLFAHIRTADLTPSQFDVMEMLYHKGPLTVNEVIQKTLSSSGNIGVVLDNLTRLGLVERAVCDTDRRVRTVALTPRGRDRIATFFPQHVKEVEAVFSSLSREEKDVLTKLLRRLGRSVAG